MLDEIPVILVVLASLVLWIVALVDVARRQFRDPNTKLLWVLVVVLAHGIGDAIYLIFGRKHGTLPAQQTAV